VQRRGDRSHRATRVDRTGRVSRAGSARRARRGPRRGRDAALLRRRRADRTHPRTACPTLGHPLVAPPPSLAKKLGLKPTTRVWVEGEVDDEALAAALAQATRANDTANIDVIVARIDDAAALASVLKAHARTLARGVRLWVVYVKGKDAPLGEAAIRTILRDRGFIDLKVASVSTRLTALQFVRRAKGERTP
jgi:hypothetical protein